MTTLEQYNAAYKAWTEARNNGASQSAVIKLYGEAKRLQSKLNSETKGAQNK